MGLFFAVLITSSQRLHCDDGHCREVGSGIDGHGAMGVSDLRL